MKKYKLLIFLLLSLFACNNEDSFFEPTTDGLKLDYKSVPGGAVLKYSLPNDRNIFSMNIRYKDYRGENVIKSCGYGGDSILLDGFIQSQNVIAQISLLDNFGKESKPFDFEFSTNDSAPWTFFDNVEVATSWNGFRVSYSKTAVSTGIAHVFYVGMNPRTQKQDTILVSSFPINSKGDTLDLVVKQERKKNTIVIRTEDFAGYRVRQEIYPDIESFIDTKLALTGDNFNDGKKSVESYLARIGIKYLFDGELRGKERFIAPHFNPMVPVVEFGSYLAGPYAVGYPFIIDMKGEKIPSKLRLYALCKMSKRYPPSEENQELGVIWKGVYEDKVPCKATVYGSNDPNADENGWKELGKLDQDPRIENPWYQAAADTQDPIDIADLESKDPIFIDINMPATNETYRYLKLVITDTFDFIKNTIDYNPQKYITLTELELFVKKD